MALADVSYGNDAPEVVNLIIEIQKGGKNKYELDKETGMIVLDRVNGTYLGYPSDYGYVPNTLCDDGDPLDGLLIIDESVPAGIVVPVRPIGVLNMVDDGEGDEKVVFVAAEDISKDHIKEVDDLGQEFKNNVEHFYSHYKDWKKDWKGVSVGFNGWGNSSDAKEIITKSIEAAKQ